MAANSFFRRLTTGITFDTNKFNKEAAKFGLVKNKVDAEEEKTPSVQLPCLDEVKAEIKAKKQQEKVVECSDDENESITVLGNIKSLQKKKKKKKTKVRIREAYAEKLSQFRNSHNIHVTGSDVPEPFNEWSILNDKHGVSENLLSCISFPNPTPIQMQTIPVMLNNRELLACAPTGSGKTVSFLLPIIHQLKEPRNGGYRAVIIVPTKELAVQIVNECNTLCAKSGLRTHMLTKVKPDKKVTVKHDIIVSPPNRLVYMLEHDPPLIQLDKVEWLVVDEADKLFEAGVTGFRDQLASIHRACSGPKLRRAMLSATLGPEVESWCKLNFDNIVRIRVGAANSATETIDQKLVYCGSEAGKLLAFRNIVKAGIQPPVLVFVQTKERASELFKELLYDGINVDVIHSERSEQQRENTIRAFRSGGIWVLICTELLGRGIDFKGVNLVINYDFPPSAVSYIHRIGRTGRAGRSGEAITFFTEQDRTILRNIAQVMRNSGCEVPDYMLSLKKANRDDRKKLMAKAPKRSGISTVSKYEKEQNKKKEDMIAASKKRKLEGKVKKVKNKKMKLVTATSEMEDEFSDEN